MSAKLAMRVHESDLPPRLKLTAAVLALFFASDTGENIFPSVGRVAWLTGKSDRQIRADLGALCRIGVLTAVTARTGGAGRTTRYRLEAHRLPARQQWARKGGSPQPRSAPQKAEADSRVWNPLSDDEPGNPPPPTRKFETETRIPIAANPEVGFRRSVSDQLEERLVDHKAGTAAAPPRTRLAKAPNGNSYKPIAAVARELLKEQEFTTEADFIEATKQKCADLGIDYGNDSAVPFDVVHRATASEWFKHRNPSLVGARRA
jgi:hypothetical protein